MSRRDLPDMFMCNNNNHLSKKLLIARISCKNVKLYFNSCMQYYSCVIISRNIRNPMHLKISKHNI